MTWKNSGCRGALLMLLCALAATAEGAPLPGSAAIVERATAALCDKRVAALAELPSHGEAHAFRLKAKIAEALVERCGFDGILFEAPIYDFVALETRWAQHATTPLELDRAIGRFWWARELAPWRRWLFEAAAEGRLRVGGIDDQVSITSERARADLPDLVARRSAEARSEHCRGVVDRHLHWRYDEAHPFDANEQQALLQCAREVAAAEDDDAIGAVLAGNFESFVTRQLDPAGAQGRDAVMATNLAWHRGRLPKHAKLIVWTATVHASKQQLSLKQAPMGALLHARLGDDYGVVAFTALAGRSSLAGRAPTVLAPAAPESLEARALPVDAALAWLDAEALAGLGEPESRLLGVFTHADWSRAFDAVIVVRDEEPAEYQALDLDR